MEMKVYIVKGKATKRMKDRFIRRQSNSTFHVYLDSINRWRLSPIGDKFPYPIELDVSYRFVLKGTVNVGGKNIVRQLHICTLGAVDILFDRYPSDFFTDEFGKYADEYFNYVYDESDWNNPDNPSPYILFSNAFNKVKVELEALYHATDEYKIVTEWKEYAANMTQAWYDTYKKMKDVGIDLSSQDFYKMYHEKDMALKIRFDNMYADKVCEKWKQKQEREKQGRKEENKSGYKYVPPIHQRTAGGKEYNKVAVKHIRMEAVKTFHPDKYTDKDQKEIADELMKLVNNFFDNMK
jgi:hypothetical protein